MKKSFLIVALCGAFTLNGCNSTQSAKLAASCDANCHAHHTPEQHAAFLKRVGQLETEESADTSGLAAQAAVGIITERPLDGFAVEVKGEREAALPFAIVLGRNGWHRLRPAEWCRSKPLAKRAFNNVVASERLAVVPDDFCGQSWVANINATKETTNDR